MKLFVYIIYDICSTSSVLLWLDAEEGGLFRCSINSCWLGIYPLNFNILCFIKCSSAFNLAPLSGRYGPCLAINIYGLTKAIITCSTSSFTTYLNISKLLHESPELKCNLKFFLWFIFKYLNGITTTFIRSIRLI